MSEKKSEDIIDMFIIIFGIIFVITNGLFSLKNEWEEKFNYREIQKYELISASCFSEDSSNETAFKLYHLKELEEEYYILCTIQNDGTISPPLNPAFMVSAVKTIFQRKANGLLCPSSTAFIIRLLPAPI